MPGDTADTLAARVLTQEHLIYPKVVAELLSSFAIVDVIARPVIAKPVIAKPAGLKQSLGHCEARHCEARRAEAIPP